MYYSLPMYYTVVFHKVCPPQNSEFIFRVCLGTWLIFRKCWVVTVTVYRMHVILFMHAPHVVAENKWANSLLPCLLNANLPNRCLLCLKMLIKIKKNNNSTGLLFPVGSFRLSAEHYIVSSLMWVGQHSVRSDYNKILIYYDLCSSVPMGSAGFIVLSQWEWVSSDSS